MGLRAKNSVALVTVMVVGLGGLSVRADDPPKRLSSVAVKMEFVLIPTGKFKMGTRWTPEEVMKRTGRKHTPRDGYPVHEVEIDAFYIGTTEVTVRQWKTFVRDTKYRSTAKRANAEYKWHHPEFKQNARHPVVYISYEDAAAFANWLSKKDGATYRLPTEAEWEYACRAGAETELPWGNEEKNATQYANLHGVADGHGHTAPVGSFEPNAWGLYDMIGNTWEWCSDWVADDYYNVSPNRNPIGPEHGEFRAYRGGSWEDTLWNARPSTRNRQAPNRFYRNSGFRLVREVKLPQKPKFYFIFESRVGDIWRIDEYGIPIFREPEIGLSEASIKRNTLWLLVPGDRIEIVKQDCLWIYIHLLGDQDVILISGWIHSELVQKATLAKKAWWRETP